VPKASECLPEFLSLLKNLFCRGIGLPWKLARDDCLPAEEKIGYGCDPPWMGYSRHCIRATELEKGNERPPKHFGLLSMDSGLLAH
jgi:hypothetical protein